MSNGNGKSKCEECGKLMGDLVYERKGKLVCRKCAYKADGRHIHKESDE